MKRNLLSLILILALGVTYAQYNLDPVPSSVTFTSGEFDVHADASFTYSGSSPITLSWNIIELNVAKEWNIYTCLGEACYPPGVFEGTVAMNPGDIFPVQAHIMPSGVCQNGDYKITFTDPSNGAVVASGNFLFECSTSSVFPSGNATKKGSIYPNPATTWFSIESVPNARRIELYNIIGKQIAQFEYQNEGRYDIGNLAGGLYLVRVLDSRGQQLTTKRLSKNTP